MGAETDTFWCMLCRRVPGRSRERFHATLWRPQPAVSVRCCSHSFAGRWLAWLDRQVSCTPSPAPRLLAITRRQSLPSPTTLLHLSPPPSSAFFPFHSSSSLLSPPTSTLQNTLEHTISLTPTHTTPDMAAEGKPLPPPPIETDARHGHSMPTPDRLGACSFLLHPFHTRTLVNFHVHLPEHS